MSKFAIRRVRSGPAELRGQLPVTGHAVATRTDPGGVADFIYAVLDKPLKFHPPAHFKRDRRRLSEELGTDEQGSFLWVSAVTLRPHGTREHPYTGMRDFAVDLAYVVDPSVDEDHELVQQKVAPVAVVEIDDTGIGSPTPNGTPHHAEAPLLSDPEGFRRELQVLAGAMATLAGLAADDVVVPPQVESADAAVDGRAAYAVGADVLRYHSWDSDEAQWRWRETASPDELAYWMIDDLASSSAWMWAQDQPAFASMRDNEAVNELWVPQWQSLLAAVWPTWSGLASSAAALPQVHSDRSWEELVAGSISAAHPRHERPQVEPVAESEPPAADEKPWSVGVSTGPPPETFMSEEEPWYSRAKTKAALLGGVGVAAAVAVAFLLWPDGSVAPVVEDVPSVAPTPASSQAVATEPQTTRSSTPPPAPAPPPVEAEQITPPNTRTYYPTWTADDSDEEEVTTRTRPPPAPLYTPPVFRDE